MTCGIFNIATGNAVDWYKSEESALIAVAEILDSEPDAIDEIGLAVWDDEGRLAYGLDGGELEERARQTSGSQASVEETVNFAGSGFLVAARRRG